MTTPAPPEHASEGMIVLTNVPDADTAQQLARLVVEAGLAACVNILAPCTSVYRWQGKLETATEIPLLMKSVRQHYAALESAIKSHHPYELPEIVCVPITAGLPAYLAWLGEEFTV